MAISFPPTVEFKSCQSLELGHPASPGMLRHVAAADAIGLAWEKQGKVSDAYAMRIMVRQKCKLILSGGKRVAWKVNMPEKEETE